MNRSEIFDEFIKIATEKGLVSKGEAEHTEQNTKNPRWDSLDISAIEALYGVKPESSKSMDYKHNIMEIAHPNSVVISPAYDKLNGLVENEMERQNITMHILYKEPEMGSPNQFKYPNKPSLAYPNKYASKDLMMALVRVANDMDNKNQDELRVLADTCLEQMHHGLRKQAFLPWLIGAAALLAGIYWAEHGDGRDQGLDANYQNLLTKLSDLISSDITLGWGAKYDEQLKTFVGTVENKLSEFWQAYELIMTQRDIKDAKDLASKTTTEGARFADALERMPVLVKDMYKSLDDMKAKFSDIDYKAQHTADKGGITSLIDKVPFLHGGTFSEFGDKLDEVINTIGPFKESVDRFMNGSYKKIKDVSEKMVTSLSSDVTSSQNATPPTPKEKTVEDIDKESSGIGEMLGGLVPGIK